MTWGHARPGLRKSARLVKLLVVGNISHPFSYRRPTASSATLCTITSVKTFQPRSARQGIKVETIRVFFVVDNCVYVDLSYSIPLIIVFMTNKFANDIFLYFDPSIRQSTKTSADMISSAAPAIPRNVLRLDCFFKAIR